MSPALAFDLCVVGMGVAGLSQTFVALKRGLRVAIVGQERETHGSSVQNFGFFCPIGQPAGPRLEAALLSRDLWLEALAGSGCMQRATGSLLTVQTDAELAVIEAFQAGAEAKGYRTRLLSPDEAAAKSPAVRRELCRGGLFSDTEINIDPRQAIPAVLARCLAEGATAFRSAAVAFDDDKTLVLADGRRIRAERFVLCEGQEPRKLFPQVFAAQAESLKLCKLQMFKRQAPPGFDLGPVLWSGLSLPFYPCFRDIPGVDAVRDEMNRRDPRIWERGVHLLASQDRFGNLVLGDSHDYSDEAQNSFLDEEVFSLIERELETAFSLPSGKPLERWAGHYLKRFGGAFFCHDVSASIRILNGFGGAGMTLALGVAEMMARNWSDLDILNGLLDRKSNWSCNI
ncbi:MAG: hypothetical protein RL095_2777 [Verrucomicrobiota bacterium]|jgi:FAD dependent oxidoreductase TIGR03364